MELDGLPLTVMTPPAVTLTFDLLTGKPNPDVFRPRCHLILVKLAAMIMKILYSPGFSGHCLRWPWPSNPKQCNQRIYLWPKLGEIPFIGFWDMVFTMLFGSGSLPAVKLTFDQWTRKPNQYVFWPRYICDRISAKLASTVTNILYLSPNPNHTTIIPSIYRGQKLAKFPSIF